MRLDYHMHFEYGDYDVEWVKGFFESAKENGLNEIGISEHTHTFPEFESLYYDDLILDDSFVGSFQKKWLKRNKFKHTIDDYFAFVRELQSLGYPVKIGIEVCNFRDQKKVKEILDRYEFDYIIGSVHFLRGWAYDSGEIKAEWENHSLRDIYEWYTEEIEHLASSGLYDILGHPFNIRLFKHIPDFDAKPYLTRACKALKDAGMVVDVNTGTFYRYPIAEISPYPDFMEIAAEYGIPVITTSDAHHPKDCGKYNAEAVEYIKKFGYSSIVKFDKRAREDVAV